jgi:ATP phosphoribosyltransferase
MITIALPKGRLGEEAEEIMIKAGVIRKKIPQDSRKLIFDLSDTVRILLVRAQDVATYVEMGTADIGIVGKDVLVEHNSEVLELTDLKLGYCKMVVAAKKGTTKENLFSMDFLKVGTKYPSIAKKFFSNISIQSEIIKLYGSVELAAVTGMSDCIVDIVSTGATLKDNGLEVIEELFESTARLVCNRSSFYRELEAIEAMTSAITKTVAGA